MIDFETLEVGTKIRDKFSGVVYDFIGTYRGFVYATVVDVHMHNIIACDDFDRFELAGEYNV